MTKLRKIFQYIRIVFMVGFVIIYYHFRYMVKFAKNPDKYPFEYRYKMVRKEICIVLKAFHIDYRLYGKDFNKMVKDKPLIISNHLSDSDPMIYIALSERPITFVAKKEIKNFIFIGKIMTAVNCFFIDRENLMSQVNVIKDVVRFIKDPDKPFVCIFIEGTRNRHPENTCLPFHPGTLRIAQMADKDMLPLTLYSSFRLFTLKSYLKKYPIFIKVDDLIKKEVFESTNTNELAVNLNKQISLNVDDFRDLDKEYVYQQKLTKKRKALETIVDKRVNS